MKKMSYILSILSICLFTSNANALHGTVYGNETIQYCSDTLLCDVFPAIEVGTSIESIFSYDLLTPFPDLGGLNNYSITVTGPSATSIIDMTNSSILFNDAGIFVDEFEVTTFTGGTIIIDTTSALSAPLGISSQFRFNFDLNRTDFYVDNILVATTSPVPVPAAVWLFGSGLIGLSAFAKRRRIY